MKKESIAVTAISIIFFIVVVGLTGKTLYNGAFHGINVICTIAGIIGLLLTLFLGIYIFLFCRELLMSNFRRRGGNK
jgi:uncharacterized membrane protein